MKLVLPVVALLGCSLSAAAMGFYIAPPPTTLREEADRAKFVVTVRVKDSRNTDDGGTTDFVVLQILKGDGKVKVGDVIRREGFIDIPDPKKPPEFLAFGDHSPDGKPELYRGEELSPALLDYFNGLLKIAADDRVKLLRYAFDFLERKESPVSSDALVMFQKATDADVREAVGHLDPAKLRDWLKAASTGVRRGQYARLLACCGDKTDAALLRKLLDKWVKEETPAGIAEVLAAYTILDPKAGWAYTRDLVKNPDNAFIIRYSGLRAARYFHDTCPGVLTRDEILGVAGLALKQEDMADLPIEYLRNWREWALTEEVLGLWGKKGFEEPIIRRRVVKYALQCPDQRAAKFIAELRKTNPKLVEEIEERLKEEAVERDDILVADFEGDAYPDGWKTTGTAFGEGPAKGTLPNQMAVSGFLGKGLVNSFNGGDASTGTLTSPAFKVERKYLNFLVGGGKHEKTCVNLLVDGKVVRTATGPNDKPGGSERLDWHTWDVAEFQGKEVVIQIVDEETGGWGHINADHFVQSDKKKQAEWVTQDFHKVEKQYLHLPVKAGAPVRRVQIVIREERDGGPDRSVLVDRVVREFDIELAVDEKPDYWAFADVSAFKGKHLGVKTLLPGDSKALDALKLADDVPDAEKLYREKHRPLFHFTSRFGWLNDPNGLVYHDNEWHLFYQHNPFGVNWGNMHWGHAVSSDLFHWKELGIGLYPRKYGDWAFSGSAVVDKGNTSGWGLKEKPPLVLAYTSTGRGECIAYSTDNGRTWTEYEKNPVVKHSGRDPKLVWYEKGKHWVMAVYDEFEKKRWIAFYTSPDLKAWTFASRIEGFYECPDLFEMPLNNAPKNAMKWVLYAADGKYLVGDFDGKEFKPDFKEKKQLWYGKFYAAQTFDAAPEGLFQLIEPPILVKRPRRVQIGWAQGVSFPGMPFNQQMTVPVDLDLRQLPADRQPTLVAMPAEELQALRDGKPAGEIEYTDKGKVVNAATVLAENLDAFELVLLPGNIKGTGFTLDLRGTKLVYDEAKQTLTCKDVTARLNGTLLSLEVLVDRGSVEVFADGGSVAMSIAAIPDEKNRKVELIPNGGEMKVSSATVWRMKSAWEK